MMMCVVVGPSRDARSCVGASLRSLGMEVTLLASVQELPEILKTTPACGILLEAVTSMEETRQGAEEIHKLIDLYPFATFRIVSNKVLILGEAESLEEFVDQCRRFTPRVIRREDRTAMHLAVYLSADKAFKDAEKAVTINVSDSGCFVYSIRKWTIGDRVWLRLHGDDVTISGIVCAWQPWGNDKFIPGVGIELDKDFIAKGLWESERNGLSG